MDDYPVPTLPPVNILRTEKHIPLSFSAPALYGDIPELRTKRIIALGETLHGSSTLNRSAFQLIEHQVKNNNCRLVLLELPSEQMLSFNRFIQGDETFCLDSLLTDNKHSLLSREQMSDLMLRLQKHNAGTKDKVWLLGMDYDNYTANSAMFLFDYLCTLNQTSYCSAIDSLCAILLKEEPFVEAADWLTGPQKEAFKKKIPKKEYDILLHCINTSLKRRGTEPPEFIRDEAMYENIKFFIDIICPEKERAIIYAHLKHTNPHNHLSTSIFSSSFGSWMKEEYPNDYFNIAMLVGSGTFTTYDWSFSKITMSLEKPYANTLEYALKDMQTEYFYMPVSEIPTRPVYLREIGNAGLKDQYCIIYPYNRMDAVIYIDQSAPLDATSIIPGEITHPYLIAEQRYKRNLVKVQS